MRYEALARENGELRGLRAALPPVADRWLAAEIVSVQLSSLRHRLLINRGAVNGVFKAQAVLDDRGLIGQTAHVGPWSAEVILITDPEHAVPVRIERTGLRTIAVGAGDATSLGLPYLPSNADIKSGDLLVTSGLGGVFPEGYPVARVTEVHRDAVQPLAQVRPSRSRTSTPTARSCWYGPSRRPTPPPTGKPLGELQERHPFPATAGGPPRPQSAAPGRRLPRSPPGRDRRRLCRASSPPNHRLPNAGYRTGCRTQGRRTQGCRTAASPAGAHYVGTPQAGAPHAAA